MWAETLQDGSELRSAPTRGGGWRVTFAPQVPLTGPVTAVALYDPALAERPSAAPRPGRSSFRAPVLRLSRAQPPLS